MTVSWICFAVSRRRKLFAIAFLTVLGACELYSSKIHPRYMSTAAVDVEIPPLYSMDILSDSIALNVESQIFLGILHRDAQITDMVARSLYGPERRPDPYDHRSRIRSATVVSLDEDSSLISISVTSNDPSWTTLCADAMAEAIVRYQVIKRKQLISELRSDLTSFLAKADVSRPGIMEVLEHLDHYEAMTPPRFSVSIERRGPSHGFLVYPNYKTFRLVGFFFALLIGIAAAGLAESFHEDNLRRARAMRFAMGADTPGAVPLR
ncbi:MAG: hypothetical protein AAB229_03235 [Candidatus Hydrogenedentota bacterium]